MILIILECVLAVCCGWLGHMIEREYELHLGTGFFWGVVWVWSILLIDNVIQ